MDDTAGALASAGSARPLVLVVDDNPDTLAICSRALGAAGYRTVTTDSATDALARFDELHPAVVVLDLVMPEQDGFQAARAIRARVGDGLPILVFTALTTDVERQAREAGATAFCTTPLEPRRLVAEVRRLCPAG